MPNWPTIRPAVCRSKLSAYWLALWLSIWFPFKPTEWHTNQHSYYDSFSAPDGTAIKCAICMSDRTAIRDTQQFAYTVPHWDTDNYSYNFTVLCTFREAQ